MNQFLCFFGFISVVWCLGYVILHIVFFFIDCRVMRDQVEGLRKRVDLDLERHEEILDRIIKLESKQKR